MFILDGCKITIPITIWETWDKEKEKFVHNHIEDGWVDGNKPIPNFKSQNGWLKQEWRKEYAHLAESKVAYIVS